MQYGLILRYIIVFGDSKTYDDINGFNINIFIFLIYLNIGFVYTFFCRLYSIFNVFIFKLCFVICKIYVFIF